jgi:hypothetical protein
MYLTSPILATGSLPHTLGLHSHVVLSHHRGGAREGGQVWREGSTPSTDPEAVPFGTVCIHLDEQ